MFPLIQFLKNTFEQLIFKIETLPKYNNEDFRCGFIWLRHLLCEAERDSNGKSAKEA